MPHKDKNKNSASNAATNRRARTTMNTISDILDTVNERGNRVTFVTALRNSYLSGGTAGMKTELDRWVNKLKELA